MHSPPPRAARKRSAQRPAVVVVEARIKPHSDSRYITFSKFYTAQARTASPPHKDAGREKPRASPPPPLPPTPPPPPPLPHRSGDRPVRRSRSRQPASRSPAPSPAAALTPCRRPARWRHAAAELGPAQSRYRLPRSPLGTGQAPSTPFPPSSADRRCRSHHFGPRAPACPTQSGPAPFRRGRPDWAPWIRHGAPSRVAATIKSAPPGASGWGHEKIRPAPTGRGRLGSEEARDEEVGDAALVLGPVGAVLGGAHAVVPHRPEGVCWTERAREGGRERERK